MLQARGREHAMQFGRLYQAGLAYCERLTDFPPLHAALHFS
jgi:hypothetical protein